jgi:hypothetical protein
MTVSDHSLKPPHSADIASWDKATPPPMYKIGGSCSDVAPPPPPPRQAGRMPTTNTPTPLCQWPDEGIEGRTGKTPHSR